MKTYTKKELYRLAMAAGQDAANRRMKKEGRTEWSDEDYAEAVQVFNKIYGSQL